MAVQKEPIVKKCRTLGISLGVMGVAKKESQRFKNANNRRKVSEYGLQLKEKQKLKFIYGVLEKQFYHYYELATKMEGKTGDNLITLLESRLDSVVFRMGLALTRREARQLVAHAHFTVNGKKVNIPSYRVKVGDVIALREKDRTSEKFKSTVEATRDRVTPLWLDANKENFSATVVRMPSAEDIEYEAATHLIVELYSK
ncbi:MAG: 30S ribosomal protein S4 [Oscillospiraceae bacterium]|nr:30S ribosomal protein S4 [Oscillospiraceae bacterium]